jgi:hypothetical protein
MGTPVRIIGFLVDPIESWNRLLYISKSQERIMLSRIQIIEFTRKIRHLVEANQIGVAPRSDKHLQRFQELKARKELEKEASCSLRQAAS